MADEVEIVKSEGWAFLMLADRISAGAGLLFFFFSFSEEEKEAKRGTFWEVLGFFADCGRRQGTLSL